MPELPEVEAIRRGLEKVLIGQKILQTTVKMPKLVSGIGTKRVVDPQKTFDFITYTKNKVIQSVDRRNKNLILQLDDNSAVIIHLKMTGQLVYKSRTSKEFVSGGHPIELSQSELPNKHTHIIFELQDGDLFFNDIRQFGYLLYFGDRNESEFADHFLGLGVEPLSTEFTLEHFSKGLSKTKSVLKKVLLDQKIVVGLGNIYADEVCFDAKILPFRNTQTLKKAEIQRLYNSIIEILKKAIAEGGSSVANYLLADGSRGNYARFHKVYGRSGKPCLVCNQILLNQKLAGRSTVWCPNCQK